MCVCVYVNVCMCVLTGVRADVGVCMLVCVHVGVCACVHVCAHMCVCVCMGDTCVYLRERVNMCACVCTCASMHMHARVCGWLGIGMNVYGWMNVYECTVMYSYV